MSNQLKNFIIGIFLLSSIAVLVGLVLFLKPSIGDEKQTLLVLQNKNLLSLSLSPRPPASAAARRRGPAAWKHCRRSARGQGRPVEAVVEKEKKRGKRRRSVERRSKKRERWSILSRDLCSSLCCSLTCFRSPPVTSASKWACNWLSAVRERTISRVEGERERGRQRYVEKTK